MTHYRNLEAWKKSMDLAKEVYILLKLFPKEELFTLTAQIKRAVISVPSNIAEGCGRNYKRETIEFLHISRGSIYELETQLSIAVITGILEESYESKINPLTGECIRLINGLISYFEKSNLK